MSEASVIANAACLLAENERLRAQRDELVRAAKVVLLGFQERVFVLRDESGGAGAGEDEGAGGSADGEREVGRGGKGASTGSGGTERYIVALARLAAAVLEPYGWEVTPRANRS